MTLPVVTHTHRSAIGRMAALPCLVLAMLGCGGKSSKPDGENGGATGGAAGGSHPGASGSGGTTATGGAGAGAEQTGGAPDGTAGGHAGEAAGTAGSAGLGGVASDGGAAGSAVAGEGGATLGSCFNVTGGGDEPWHDLTIIGSQFDADEGARIRIAVASGGENRVGIADTSIVGGAFTIAMPEVLNHSFYMGVTIYMDRNSDDTCQPDEQVWAWTTPGAKTDLEYTLTPTELCSRELGFCTPDKPANPPCVIGSGDTVLTEPLPCTP